MRPVRLPGSGPKPHKYRAKPRELDGHRFDSQREAHRWCELRLLEKVGEIDQLEVHPVFPLLAPTGKRDAFTRIGIYEADFRYRVVKTGQIVVEDAKGVRTAIYRWKKRHVESQYGIQVQEV